MFFVTIQACFSLESSNTPANNVPLYRVSFQVIDVINGLEPATTSRVLTLKLSVIGVNANVSFQ